MAYSCSQPYEFSDKEEGIKVLWDHPTLGVIPFLAMPTDCEEHGRQIYAEAISEEYGPVVSYADSHWYSTSNNNSWDGRLYNAGDLMISPTGTQPPNSTQTPPPQF